METRRAPKESWQASKKNQLKMERRQKEKQKKNAYIGRKDLHNVHYYSLDSIALPSNAAANEQKKITNKCGSSGRIK